MRFNLIACKLTCGYLHLIFLEKFQFYEIKKRSIWISWSVTKVVQAALQIRAGQQSITANLWPMTAHIYHVMIIVTFPRNLFYYHFFLGILLNILEFVFLEFKHFYKTNKISLFSFYLFIFYLFCNNSVY